MADFKQSLRRGLVIPASPLALTASRRWDERRQRVLFRYYHAAGAGGLAVGVHTTQFAIRDPRVGLFKPLLALAAEEMNRADAIRETPFVRVGGICGPTSQAVAEAGLLQELGYHAGLLSLGAWPDASEEELIDHAAAVAERIPLFGFYLQPAAGGRVLSHRFWERLLENPNLVGIKIAPFNRYQTIDVVRAAAESGREDVALYTGNDDNIIFDLLTPYRFSVNGRMVERRLVGGLLGQWAVWTRPALALLSRCHEVKNTGGSAPSDLLRLSTELTDANSALFDAAHGFAGCIAGIQEVLRRQGILESNACLEAGERLSPGQAEEIDRVCHAYPHLMDDDFVRENLDAWLR
jgi:Dihydrodipicolinate synthetase family